MKTAKRVLARERKHKRVRKKIFGTPERPRLSVYRSLDHVYAQVIDDLSGKTLVSFSSLNQEGLPADSSKSDKAKAVGEKVAALAQAANIKSIVFDRGGYLYHGRVKALAEAARAGGLLF
ncbi:MAG: 50S ribosomal protein L18 [Nitrospirota bacterium]